MIKWRCFFPLIFLACQSSPPPAEDSSVEPSAFTTLFRPAPGESVACYRIPALVTAANGDLIAAADERHNNCGDLRANDNINIVIRRSSDKGHTWSDLETVVDYPRGASASDPSFILDHESGELFMFFNYMNLETEKNIYYLRVAKSSDHGKSWSEPVDITSQLTPPEWHQDFKFITSGRGVQTRDGSLVHTLVNLEKGLFLFLSADHGKSWQLLETQVHPGDESKFIELSDGTWMINSRVNDGSGYRYVHRSADRGKTWDSKPANELTDPQCNASLLRMPTDDQNRDYLLFSNPNDPRERKNLSVRLSTDEGKHWQNTKVIYPAEAAYSSLSAIDDQQIGLLFEKDDYQEITFVRFSLQWLLSEEE